MKLALIRQCYTPFGGAERFLERALVGLGRDDIEVTVIARDWPGDTQSPFQRRIVRPFALGRAWRDAAFARAACAEVARGGFDLVQSHERVPCCDIFRAGDGVHREWLIQRARRRGALARLSDRLSPFHCRLLAAEQTLFSSPKLQTVICNSRMVRDEIMAHYGVPGERLHVIPNGVDGEVFHPRLRQSHRAALRQSLGVAETDPVFLFVGSGFERKGVDILLDLWSQLPASARLWVVGRDSKLKRYRRRAEAAGLGDRVHFAGPQQVMTPWYGAADVFVLPTLYDPQPNAALEALSSGLPVLSSRKSGAAELIEEGINGAVMDALDQTAWLAALREWCDPVRAQAAAVSARAAVADLTPAALQQALRDLYARLLNKEPACSN